MICDSCDSSIRLMSLPVGRTQGASNTGRNNLSVFPVIPRRHGRGPSTSIEHCGGCWCQPPQSCHPDEGGISRTSEPAKASLECRFPRRSRRCPGDPSFVGMTIADDCERLRRARFHERNEGSSGHRRSRLGSQTVITDWNILRCPEDPWFLRMTESGVPTNVQRPVFQSSAACRRGNGYG
jgi:hypothetical protein